MRKTETLLHGEARDAILRGVNAVNDAVKLTLGVEGASVLLHRSFNRGSRITNDGVTVAKCIEPKDEFENLVATCFKEGSSKTGERAGDGTTSTCVISAKLINDVLSKTDQKLKTQFTGISSSKVGVVAIKKKILASIPIIKAEIAKVTKKIKTQEELEHIANVSLNDNKEVAKIIADIIWKTGENGFITLSDGFKGLLETEIIKGSRFPMKVPHVNFLTNPERFEMVAEQADCVVTNWKLDSIREFGNLWNGICNSDPKKVKPKLIIFASDFSDEVLGQMIQIMFPIGQDGKRGVSGLRIFPVKCPSLRTEQFDDLAVFLDARFIDINKGDKLSQVREVDLGFVDKCTVKSVEDREDAVLLGGKGSKNTKVQERIEILKQQRDLTKLHPYKLTIDKRIASLSSSGGLIRVGASTEAEALPLKHKIEDAVFACQNALKFGYVEGGGLCLKKIADNLYKDEKFIYDALCAPYFQIQENAGEEVKITKNIIDPARVVELEVECGFGVAANLITVKAIIPEFDEHDPKDGYKLIAEAIHHYNYYFAKREGLLKSGIDEAKTEQLERQEAKIQSELSD